MDRLVTFIHLSLLDRPMIKNSYYFCEKGIQKHI